MREHWVETYVDDRYEVSNTGRVRHKDTGKILSTSRGHGGYLRVYLDRRNYYIHRLVYFSFVDADTDGYVTHIDGDIYNNCLNNLVIKA